MKRGEVRWYTFKSPDKRRPVVILTRNTVIPVLGALTVAPGDDPGARHSVGSDRGGGRRPAS